MRKALCAAALLVLQACASVPGHVVQVEEEDSTRTLELKTGQVLDIRLMSFPGRGLTLSLGSIVTRGAGWAFSSNWRCLKSSRRLYALVSIRNTSTTALKNASATMT